MNLGQDRHMRMVRGNSGNQFRQKCNAKPRKRDAAFLQTQLLIAQKKETEIQLQAEEFDFMTATRDLEEIKEVNANCIFMAILEQASTSGTQPDKAPVYDSDGSVEVVQIYLWCVDSGCSKHMTKNLKLLINFVWKFLGMVRFGNDHITAILGYDLEVTLRRNTCFVRNLERVDLLKGNRITNLYKINLHEMASASLIFLMARATSTKSWSWHQRLSHLNFETINDLVKNDLVTSLLKLKYHKEHICPSCEQEKTKKASHPPKPVLNSKQRVYNKRTKKIIETMNVTFDKLSAMGFEQSSSKPGLQRMTFRQISSGLDPTLETTLAAQAPKVLQTPTTSTTTTYTTSTPTNSSPQAADIPNTSQDVDELQQPQHAQQQDNQAQLQTKTIADKMTNAMLDGNTFVNPFATPSTNGAESSSLQYFDPSNMHTFYQPYPNEYKWTKDHPLEQVIGHD
nr:hypothetical protein [Tanacetum cinerariifolium]